MKSTVFRVIKTEGVPKERPMTKKEIMQILRKLVDNMAKWWSYADIVEYLMTEIGLESRQLHEIGFDGKDIYEGRKQKEEHEEE